MVVNNQLIINLGFVEKALQCLGWWHTIPATKLGQQKKCDNRCHQRYERIEEFIVSSYVIAAALQVLKAQDLASAFKTLPHDQLNTSVDTLPRDCCEPIY